MQKITIYNREKYIYISEKKNMVDEFERAAKKSYFEKLRKMGLLIR